MLRRRAGIHPFEPFEPTLVQLRHGALRAVPATNAERLNGGYGLRKRSLQVSELSDCLRRRSVGGLGYSPIAFATDSTVKLLQCAYCAYALRACGRRSITLGDMHIC